MVDSPSNLQIKEVAFHPDAKQIEIDVDARGSPIEPHMKILVPRNLLDNLSSVSFLNDEGTAMTVMLNSNSTKAYLDDSDPYNFGVILIPDRNIVQININGLSSKTVS